MVARRGEIVQSVKFNKSQCKSFWHYCKLLSSSTQDHKYKTSRTSEFEFIFSDALVLGISSSETSAMQHSCSCVSDDLSLHFYNQSEIYSKDNTKWGHLKKIKDTDIMFCRINSSLLIIWKLRIISFCKCFFDVISIWFEQNE